MEEFTLRPVTGKRFVGRKSILEELVAELCSVKSMMGFCIYGRRRIGKTSLLQEVKRRLATKKDVVVVYLSFYDIANLSTRTFIEELSSSIIDAYSAYGVLPLRFKARELMKTPLSMVTKLLEGTKLSAELGEDLRVFLTFGREGVDNYSPYLRSLFNLGERLAQETGTKCVIMLDEFPEILRIENGMQAVKMFRTAHESHKRTALVISGSVRKTLEAVALLDAAPFYRQLIPRKIGPMTAGETREFLIRYLNMEDRTLAEHLKEVTGGIPFYLQYLGRVTKTVEEVEKAVRLFVREEGNILFQEEFNRLSGKEKIIAIAISWGLNRPAKIAEETGVPVNFVSRYLITLSEKEVVERTGRGVYGLTDRMFSFWLKWKFTQK